MISKPAVHRRQPTSFKHVDQNPVVSESNMPVTVPSHVYDKAMTAYGQFAAALVNGRNAFMRAFNEGVES